MKELKMWHRIEHFQGHDKAGLIIFTKNSSTRRHTNTTIEPKKTIMWREKKEVVDMEVGNIVF